ncbi:MAG: hypothetical protein IJT87_01450, partial [Ruminiclostridium sp.]|nr:hypothetical protein [Ruminiclostridium sp.]
MRREERFMNILGGLDEKYVALAMPGSCGHGAVGDTGNVTDIKPVEGNIGITKKERVMYIITRAVVIAAALALIADGALWLWSNWDKIAVSGNYRPGAVTVVSENEPTPVTDEIVYKYEGCTVKVKEYEFDGLTAKVIYEEIFDKDPGYDLQPRVAPCIADSDKEFSGKPFKLIKKDGLVYIWEKSCTQYEPSDEITLAFTDRSVSFEDHKAMQNDPAYSLVISKGLVPARVIETYKAIPLTAGNVNMKAVYICENTVTVKCEPSGLTGDELAELAEADIKIIMADGYEVLFALEPNTVNPVMETADGHMFTGRYNAGHIDTSMISSVSINGVLIWDNTADRFERITDTSMPEPFLPADTNWGARDFNAGWDIKFGDRQTAAQKDLIDMAEPGERGEYLKEAEKLYDTETPCTLYDNVNDLSCAKIMGLTNDELTEMIERRNKYYSEFDSEGLKQNIYSDEDLYMLTSGSDEKIAAYFASEYSVVVGENVFSPRWLYYHTAEDYKAAGIKPNAMNSLLEKYVELGLTEEAWRAFRKKLILYAYSEMSPEKDRVYTYETDVSEPLGDEAFRIFEDYFYGEWE